MKNQIIDIEKAQHVRSLAQKCLVACVSCDYKLATIYETLVKEKVIRDN